jgi:hypothetical protein
VGGHLEYAKLIISKEPISSTVEQYGAIIQTFTGALNGGKLDHIFSSPHFDIEQGPLAFEKSLRVPKV